MTCDRKCVCCGTSREDIKVMYVVIPVADKTNIVCVDCYLKVKGFKDECTASEKQGLGKLGII